MDVKSKFVVMKHEAKRAGLHYDLRFKQPTGNNWDSFAVRKGIPTEIGKKVLAVKTHIHSEKEALTLGDIESGYGAGNLSEFDSGECTIITYKPGHIVLDMKGKKIKGIYHLITTRMADRKNKYSEFFLFKGREKQ